MKQVINLARNSVLRVNDILNFAVIAYLKILANSFLIIFLIDIVLESVFQNRLDVIQKVFFY